MMLMAFGILRLDKGKWLNSIINCGVLWYDNWYSTNSNLVYGSGELLTIAEVLP